MNQYHIYEAIGRGKHSVVYKGRKKKTIQYYAIKSVDKTQKAKVLQEVRTLHSLDHENVLKFHAWYETSNHLWLILEYCVGGDLLTLLHQDTRLPEESIHDFARDLVKALQFLHSNGVVYCDLKPSNILLDENGRLKLCDFGLARRLSDIAKSSVQQLPQAKRGTPCYMAPELFQEGGVHSFMADLWALGCVMYECAAGKPPFVSSSFAQLAKAVLTEPPPLLPGNPSRDFEDLVMRLLIKDPCERMGWDELREHPFWRAKYKILPLPGQPALENFLRQRGRRDDGGVGSVRASIIVKAGVDGVDLGLSEGRYADENSARRASPAAAKAATEAPCDRRPSGKETKEGETTNANTTADAKTNVGSLLATGVTVLRLSRIIRNNMRRETEGEAYRQGGVCATADLDVKLANNDAEVDFAEVAEEDGGEEEESDAAQSPGQLAAEDSGGSFSPRERRGTGDSGGSAVRENGDAARGHGGEEERVDDAFDSSAKPDALRSDGTATLPGIIMSTSRKSPPRGPGGGGALDDKERRITNGSNLNGAATKGSLEDGRPGSDSSAMGSKSGVLSVSQVMWHTLDSSVKPIVLNRRIEKLQEPTFEARLLPVEALSAANLVALQSDQNQIQEFLKAIMGSISGPTQVHEKTNTLSYIETLCVDTDGANVLINSSLMPFLVKMLRSMKQPTIRIKLVSVMGLLIRHATVIDDELVGSGVVPMLTDVLRDKQDRVRRRAMAALGELLFYIATQHDGSSKVDNGVGGTAGGRDGSPAQVWQVPNSTINLVASMLRKGEDETTQHYAVKTIENIASQPGEWGMRFATADVALNLVHIMLTSKLEHLRTTAGSTVVRLVRRNQTLLPYVMDKLGVKVLVRGLAEGTSRSQQVFVSLMNLVLSGPPPIGKHVTALTEEKSLVGNVVAMLEHSADVLRGKALVMALLLSKANLRWLMVLCNAKMVQAIERLARDKDEYVQSCVQALVQTVTSLVPPLMDQISFDIDRLGNRQRPTSAGGNAVSGVGRAGTGGVTGGGGAPGGSGFTGSRGPTMLFSVLLHLVTTQTFRGRVVDQGLLTQLATYLRRLETLSFQGQDEFLYMLLHVLEALSQHTGILLEHRDTFVAYVLPRLASMYSKSGNGDVRCLCLKIFQDILSLYIEDLAAKASAAGSCLPSAPRVLPALSGGSLPVGTSVEKAKIDAMVTQHLLPLYPSLLQDEDPMPLYAQKLLVTILEHGCVTVGDVLRLRIVPRLFDFILVEVDKVKKPAMSLCVLLAASMEVESRLISEMRIVRKLGTLLEDVVAKNLDDHIAPVLLICRRLMERHVQAVQGSRGGGGSGGQVGIADIAEFGRSAEVFLELTGSYDLQIADPAGECVLWLARAVPRIAAAALLISIGRFSKVLETVSGFHSQPLLSKLQRCLLLALAVCCREHRAVLANGREFGSPVAGMPISPQTEFVTLDGILLRLRKGGNTGVMEAATEAISELQLMLRCA